MNASSRAKSEYIRSISELTAKVYIKDRVEYYTLTNQNGTVVSDYKSELGNTAVEFLYDTLFEQVIGFLQVSEPIVSNIKQGINTEEEWKRFDLLAQNLHAEDKLHPFYYPLFVEVVGAYQRGVCDEQGRPLRDDHFVQIGKQLKQFMQKLQDVMNAQDEVLDGEASSECYRRKVFSAPLPIRNLQYEMMPAESEQDGKTSFDIVMVLLPKTLEDVWNYLLANYVHYGLRFKRCENCKRFFATTGRGNPKFCERLIPGMGKSCRQVMPKLNFNSKGEKDPAVWLYNRAYKTMYSRVTAGTFPKENFKEWSKRARMARDQCTRGEMSAEDYSAWLSSNGLFIDYLKEG